MLATQTDETKRVADRIQLWESVEDARKELSVLRNEEYDIRPVPDYYRRPTLSMVGDEYEFDDLDQLHRFFRVGYQRFRIEGTANRFAFRIDPVACEISCLSSDPEARRTVDEIAAIVKTRQRRLLFLLAVLPPLVFASVGPQAIGSLLDDAITGWVVYPAGIALVASVYGVSAFTVNRILFGRHNVVCARFQHETLDFWKRHEVIIGALIGPMIFFLLGWWLLR